MTDAYPAAPARATRSQRPTLLPFDKRAGIPPPKKSDMTSMADYKTDEKDCGTSSKMSYLSQSMLGTGQTPTLSESTLTPTPFYGTGLEDAQEWLAYFIRYTTFKQLSEPATVALFALLMRGAANTWFSALEEAERNDFKAIRERFATKYAPAPISLWKRASEFWVQEQRPGQSVEDFYHEMKRRAREVGATDDTTRFALMKGLKNALRTYVMQQNPASCEEWLEAAKVAEATVVEMPSTTTSELMEAIKRIEQRVACPLPPAPRSPSPYRRNRRQQQPSTLTGRRQVHFADERPSFNTPSSFGVRPPILHTGSMPEPTWYGDPTRPPGPPRNDWAQRPAPTMSRRGWSQQRPYDSSTSGCTVPCNRCGRVHVNNTCIALGKVCRACGKMNHFAVCCRTRQQMD